MARDKVKDTKKEVAKEADDFYGEETLGGSQPKPSVDDDVDTIAKKVKPLLDPKETI